MFDPNQCEYFTRRQEETASSEVTFSMISWVVGWLFWMNSPYRFSGSIRRIWHPFIAVPNESNDGGMRHWTFWNRPGFEAEAILRKEVAKYSMTSNAIRFSRWNSHAPILPTINWYHCRHAVPDSIDPFIRWPRITLSSMRFTHENGSATAYCHGIFVLLFHHVLWMFPQKFKIFIWTLFEFPSVFGANFQSSFCNWESGRASFALLN